MNELQEIWKKFVNFLAEYDSQKIIETIHNLSWGEVLYTPLFWAAAGSIFSYLVWKRRFHTLLLLFSLVLFIVLAFNTLPLMGQPNPLSKILTFVGGSVALVAVNLCFFFVRS